MPLILRTTLIGTLYNILWTDFFFFLNLLKYFFFLQRFFVIMLELTSKITQEEGQTIFRFYSSSFCAYLARYFFYLFFFLWNWSIRIYWKLNNFFFSSLFLQSKWNQMKLILLKYDIRLNCFTICVILIDNQRV